MRDILLSIHPKHAENIYNGSKLFEFRKVLPKAAAEIRLVWLYETSPVMQVTGYFISGNILKGVLRKSINSFWEQINRSILNESFWTEVSHAPGISREEFDRYFHSKNPQAITVESTYKLSNPISLSELGIKRPPQNFMYLPDSAKRILRPSRMHNL